MYCNKLYKIKEGNIILMKEEIVVVYSPFLHFTRAATYTYYIIQLPSYLLKTSTHIQVAATHKYLLYTPQAQLMSTHECGYMW